MSSDPVGRSRVKWSAYEKLPAAGAAAVPRALGVNRYVLLAALLASISSALLGYDVGVTTGSLLFIEEHFGLGDFQKELFVSSLSLVSLVGALISGRLSDAIGRRYTIAFAAAVFLTGAIMMALAPTFTFLMVGRLVTGIGVGFGFTIAPVYTAELAPPSFRGFLVSLSEVFINIGILIGYIVSYALKGLPEDTNWRWMLAVAGVPAVAMGLGVIGMPESPRWLVMEGRVEEALIILEKSSNLPEEAAIRLAEIVEAAGLTNFVERGNLHGEWERIRPFQENLRVTLSRCVGGQGDGAKVKEKVGKDGTEGGGEGEWESEREAGSNGLVGERLAQKNEEEGGMAEGEGRAELLGGTKVCGNGVWKELLYPTPAVRKMLVVSLGTNFFQQVTGIDAAVYYSPVMFRLAGITSRTGLLAATVAVGVTKVTFTCSAMLLLDRFGRRPLLLTSATGMTISLLIESLGFLLLRQGGQLNSSTWLAGGGAAAPTITILAMCTFVASFAIGIGPINWVLTSEIFPLRLRAQAFGLGTAVNRLASGTVALTFLSIGNAVSPAGCFLIFACMGALSIVFFYVYAPETKGKTLEEIAQYFEQSGEEVAPRSKRGEASSLLEIPLAENVNSEKLGDEDREKCETAPTSTTEGRTPSNVMSKLKAIGNRGDSAQAWA